MGKEGGHGVGHNKMVGGNRDGQEQAGHDFCRTPPLFLLPFLRPSLVLRGEGGAAGTEGLGGVMERVGRQKEEGRGRENWLEEA